MQAYMIPPSPSVYGSIGILSGNNLIDDVIDPPNANNNQSQQMLGI
jgi:hypothetical protein